MHAMNAMYALMPKCHAWEIKRAAYVLSSVACVPNWANLGSQELQIVSVKCAFLFKARTGEGPKEREVFTDGAMQRRER